MDKKKNIEELFKDQFENFEVEPSADLWSNIQSGISSNIPSGPDISSLISKPVASTSSYWASTLIVGAIITGTIVGGYFYFENKTEKNKLKLVSEKVEAPSKEESKYQKESPTVEKEEISSIVESKQDLTQIKQNSDKQLEEIQPIEKRDIENHSDKVEDNPSESNTKTAEAVNSNDLNKEIQDTEVIAQPNNSSGHVEENFSHSEPSKAEVIKNTKESQENPAIDPQSLDQKEEEKTEKELITEELKAYQFPNIFTPNQDGITDNFEINIESTEIDAIEVAIFDRTSNLIKSWKTLYGKWDGTLANGDPAPTGPYFYQIVLTKDGVIVPRKGMVTLNR